MKAWNAPLEFHLRLDERHGEGCVCLALIALVGGRRDTLTFRYCLHVLQKRWRLTCAHGEVGCPLAPKPKASERWHDFGEMDPVKAILMSNG